MRNVRVWVVVVLLSVVALPVTAAEHESVWDYAEALMASILEVLLPSKDGANTTPEASSPAPDPEGGSGESGGMIEPLG